MATTEEALQNYLLRPMLPRANTNRTRKDLEQAVEGLLRAMGYTLASFSSLFFALRAMEQPIYARQCETGLDIYGKRRHVDFILYHPVKWPNALVIQCKWQASKGSVEEKYPFEILSIQKDGYPTIILLDGKGYTKGAEQWLKEQAGKNCLEHVFDLKEFERFALEGEL